MAALLAACSSGASSPAVTQTQLETLECLQLITAAKPGLTCLDSAPGVVLLQSAPGIQTTLNVQGATITFNDTVYMSVVPGTLTVAGLGGVTAVSAEAITRILRPGTQVTIPIDASSHQATGQPSEPGPYDVAAIQAAPVHALPRLVRLPDPVEVPAAEVTTEATAVVEGCAPPAGWNAVYIIQRGDTLSAIAQRYDVTVAALQAANCLTDVNFITPDQVLVVPGDDDTITPVARPIFTAERSRIREGECVTINWNVSGASAVYFEGQPAAHSEVRRACPVVTATYTLLVVYENGEQVGYTLTITVASD